MEPLFYVTIEISPNSEPSICAVIGFSKVKDAFIIITPDRKYKTIAIDKCKHYCFDSVYLGLKDPMSLLDKPLEEKEEK